jgi:hypothetical protein
MRVWNHAAISGVALVCVWGVYLIGSMVAEGAGEVTVAFKPASQAVHVGAQVDVEVQIDEVENLGAAEFRVEFDPSVLKYLGVESGGFIGSTGRQVLCPGAVVRAADVLFGCATNSVVGLPGPSGSGLLATVHFQALAPGVSDLIWTKVGVADASVDAASIEVSGFGTGVVQVLAEGASTPSHLPSTPTPDVVRLTPTAVPPGVATPPPGGRLDDPAGAAPGGDALAGIGDVGASDGSGGGSPTGAAAGGPESGGGVLAGARAPVAGYGPEESHHETLPRVAWICLVAGLALVTAGLFARPRLSPATSRRGALRDTSLDRKK